MEVNPDDGYSAVGLRLDMLDVVYVDADRSEEHTSELQSLRHLVCRTLLSRLSLHDALPILAASYLRILAGYMPGGMLRIAVCIVAVICDIAKSTEAFGWK